MDMSQIINELDSVESTNNIAERFRGFLPVVIDVETGGFNSRTDALLEIAAVETSPGILQLFVLGKGLTVAQVKLIPGCFQRVAIVIVGIFSMGKFVPAVHSWPCFGF